MTEQPKPLSKLLFDEVVQPFIDLIKAPKALWGVNLSYLFEGITYFGMLSLMTMYFNDFVKLDDVLSGRMVGVLTAGITIAMLLLGATVDLVGVRKALITSLVFMLIGRVILTLAPGLGSSGWLSSIHIASMIGILGIVIGYGIYQPACYAAVKKFSDANGSAMGYAMLYAVMNLGAFIPGIISPPIRQSFGILGVYWVYVLLTVVGIVSVALLITKKSIADIDVLRNAGAASQENIDSAVEPIPEKLSEKISYYLKNFPLKDLRFLYFIFILMPVQTLFAHNWLTLPAYFERAFTGTVSENFEFFANINPLLIFILTPIVIGITQKRDTYNMMIIGTAVMALPTFILTMGPNIYGVFIFLFIMTIGEAMWQPRFLQWVADIAPKNMTGIYMGLGQFPWFMTKIVTSMYSGWFLMNYVPDGASPEQMHSEFMWFVYGLIALISPIGLLVAKSWMKKGFKTKAEN